MNKSLNIKPREAVLISISRLRKLKAYTAPTLKDIKQELKQRYGLDYSERQLLHFISELESKGLIQRKRGLLEDGRETLFATTKGKEVVLTLIRLDREKALVHNGWEGMVYDPQNEIQRYGSESTFKPNAYLLFAVTIILILLYSFLQHLSKPIVKWKCVNCGQPMESKRFHEVIQCSCGQQYLVTLDKIWRFPFSNKNEFIVPKIDWH